MSKSYDASLRSRQVFHREAQLQDLFASQERTGIDRSKRSMLWKDRAMVEINSAVLHSFREAGVVMVDHHTACAQFVQHVAKEEKCGRKVTGDWSWLVPPMSGSACPVFHRYYGDARLEPAYVEQERPW